MKKFSAATMVFKIKSVCLFPHDLQNHWKNFYIGLKVFEGLSIPRRIFDSLASLISIHGFFDALQETHRACVYFRFSTQMDLVSVQCILLNFV